MSDERQESQSRSDHDILITLNTRWSDFMDKNWPELLDRLNSLLDRLDNKADKTDLRDLETRVRKNEQDIAGLKDTHQVEQVKKDTVINLSKAGWKFWLGIMAIVTFIITIASAI